MLGKSLRRGNELFEGRLLDDFVLAASFAAAAIQILIEEGSDIEFVEGIGRLCLRHFLSLGLDEGFFAVIFAGGPSLVSSSSIGIGDHFLRDHLAQFQTVQRQHADHLHQARRQNLLLGDLEMKFGLEPAHKLSSGGNYRRDRRAGLPDRRSTPPASRRERSCRSCTM